MNCSLIMSPNAGQREELREAVSQVRPLHTITPHWAWEPEDSARFANQVMAENPDRVLIAGGDGAINHSLSALLSKGWKKPVGIIPMGTGNDFARSVGLHTDDLKLAFAAALSDRTCTVDAVQAEDRSLFNVLSIGSGAEVTSSAGFIKELGPVGYSLKGISLLLSAKPFEANIESPQGNWSGNAWGICVGNGKFAGGGVPVCPEARLDDGLMDLVCFTGETLAQAATRVLAYTTSENAEDLFTCRSAEFSIRVQGNPPANFDGEPSDTEQYHLKVIPQAAQIAGGTL